MSESSTPISVSTLVMRMMPPATATTPVKSVPLPFTWSAVAGAASYLVEASRNAGKDLGVANWEALIRADDDAALFRINPFTFASERGLGEVFRAYHASPPISRRRRNGP